MVRFRDSLRRLVPLLEVNRVWNDGDQVDIELPMDMNLEPLRGSSEYFAAVCGPIVLVGELGTKEPGNGDVL